MFAFKIFGCSTSMCTRIAVTSHVTCVIALALKRVSIRTVRSVKIIISKIHDNLRELVENHFPIPLPDRIYFRRRALRTISICCPIPIALWFSFFYLYIETQSCEWKCSINFAGNWMPMDYLYTRTCSFNGAVEYF